jgi:hypothetical protein
MKNLGCLILIALTTLFGASCGKKEISAAPNGGNSNAADLKTNGNSNQKSEPLSTAEMVRLKPSAPCGWFEESLKLKPVAYEQSLTMPDMYYCVQVKPLVNQSNFEYHVVGDAEKVKYLYVSVRPGARNDLKQDAQLQNMLTLAAQEALDKASGQKLTEEILDALLMSETKDFTLEPGDDKTKPQVKTVSIKKQNRDGKPWKYVKGIELRFE